MAVVFGALLAAPVVEAPVPWAGYDMTWTGWDGSEWSLTDSSTGSVMLPGVRGLNMPPIIHHRAAHASLPGARWRGYSVDVRECFWPIQIYSGDGSQEWIERDRAFWKTMDPSMPGTWAVIQPDGTKRTLRLRYSDNPDQTFTHDSAKAGWDNYGITFAAEQPFWEGTPLTKGWDSSAGDVPFFSTSSTSVLGISKLNTTTKAKLNNPGDVDAWPVWRIYGPATSATVGVSGRTITVPVTIPDGRCVEINTDPGAQTAKEGPAALFAADSDDLVNDWTDRLGNIDFAPLKPRQTSTLTLTVVGGGAIGCMITPRYFRAW